MLNNIIKKSIGFSIGIIPFVAALIHGLTEKDTISNMISIIVLGMAFSFILIGFMSNSKKTHDSSILVGIGLLLSGISMGVYFLGSIIIFLG
jgi:hypothetical protein